MGLTDGNPGREKVWRQLDTAWKGSAPASGESYDLASGRIVVFSDHHRGLSKGTTIDAADDFRRCVRAYKAALAYYLEEGYTLVLLGDVEELWENSPADVIEAYADVLALERKFREADPSRLVRIYGNHDDLWAHPRSVEQHLGPWIGDTPVREALQLPFTTADGTQATLFFVHGHQGTAVGWFARKFVRCIWRPIQRKTGYSATTPATDHDLRGDHDEAMYAWARARPSVVMIAGHTHRPVFYDSPAPPPPPSTDDGVDPASTEAAHAYVAAANDRRPPPFTFERPCYFNTGCCSFPDGDITGIELLGDEIRLVRWPINPKELTNADGKLDAAKRRLVGKPLSDVARAVNQPG